MSLVSCKEMVNKAYKDGYAVAAINSNGGNYDIMRACIETAEEMKAPLIINCYANNGRYAGLGYVAHSAKYLIEQFAPNVPVAIHLDHGQTFEDCVEALRAGFSSIMCDVSDKPLEENIRITKKVVEIARVVNVSVEAELGMLEGDPDSPNIVQVDDVKEFVKAVSGLDMLAVAIGNKHGYYQGEPHINVTRLKEVRRVTDLPLVLHGCTGIPEKTVRECVHTGMAKINFGTMLRNNYLKYFCDAYQNANHQGHPWRVMQAAKDKLKDDVRWILNLTESEGKA